MNTYVSDEIREKFQCLEFLGKKMTMRNGKTYIKAHHVVLDKTMYYCFEDDFAWFVDGKKPWEF